jgi:putative ABC transport system permease protein
MLANYFKIALRNIFRSKTYSLINISGLSIGVACCLLLALYIQDEMSFDKHHENLDNIYRLVTKFESEKFNETMGTASPPIAMALPAEIPEVENAARLLNPPGVAQNLIRYEDNTFYEDDGFLGDSTLFDVLTYDFVEGSPSTALVEANSVVITDRLARKIFGTEPALNNIIHISQEGAPIAYTITGVFKDNPKTHVHANFIVSMTSDGWAAYMRSENAADEWGGQNFVPSYIRLTPGANVASVERKMNEVLTKYGSEDMKALGLFKTLSLEPVKDIYLDSPTDKSPRSIYLYVIGSIAIFILLIACINFMNLSTAKATKRANEIGVRKVMGAFRSSLIGQLLGEAMMIVLLSIVISAGLVQVALPYFNELTGKTISFDSNNMGYYLIALGAIALVTGLVAGSYPAFYISSFRPAEVLKGKSTLTNSAGWLRRSLVVFQFMIAIALVCGMLIISRQLTFIQEKDLGFDAGAKVVLPLRTATAKNAYSGLQKQLTNLSGISQVTGAFYIPGSRVLQDAPFYPTGSNIDLAVLLCVNHVENNYLQSLNIPLAAGRHFSANNAGDGSRGAIINRTGAKKLGFEPEQAVGQPIFSEWQGEKYYYDIIGVMEDFHQTSLKDEIVPLIFTLPEDDKSYSYVVATVEGENFKQSLASIEKTWKTLINDTPFEYSFLDEKIRKQYEEDQKVARVITSFTVIAMLISCLGLYGLSSYMAERRFKEIGIRKVMGADVSQIVGLMSTEFIKLVMVAFVIAVPLSWYMMHEWLQGFAYHTPIDPLVFVYAGTAALSVALLTVSFESIKAATTNPVKSLKNE